MRIIVLNLCWEKIVKPADKREADDVLIKEQQCTTSKACKLVQLPRSSYEYKSKPKDDSGIEEALTEVVDKHPAIGFWQSYHRFRNRGKLWNHKKVRRIYPMMNLNIKRKAKKRLPERIKQPLVIPVAANKTWSINFMSGCINGWKKVQVIQCAR